ncbi:aa3-type cytochrome oxidase subunit II [Nocardioides sp. SYSU DS0663]|uniref:aa3-type cytochrome oxidase subunit II n=1 Tax=Nocardioides sp. SYSU DS0663 TaxID=3416445 RepID=UPI003F4BE169
MGLQLPQRAAGKVRRGRRPSLLAAVVGLAVVLLAGCSEESQGEWTRLAMPEPATAQGEHTLALWQGAWIAAWITGLIVWMLIFWVVVRYRRRSADEIPIQTRYNLPLEIFYTVAPIVMVIVFFSQTVRVQNIVLDDEVASENTIEVVGQQWSWTFNYGLGDLDPEGDEDSSDDEYPYDRYVYSSGTASDIPTLYLPVGVTTQFNLHSPDVIHDFGVPSFLMKMDVIPGRVNHYQVTPTEIGTFPGKCYELCGVYHSRMLFDVEVVSQEDYAAHLEELEEIGNTADAPLIGGENPNTQVGLAEEADDLTEGATE